MQGICSPDPKEPVKFHWGLSFGAENRPEGRMLT